MRRRVLASVGKPLPFKRKLAWIRNDGSSYLLLDFFDKRLLRVEAKFRFPSKTREMDILSNQDEKTGRFVLGTANGYIFGYSRNPSFNDGNVITNTLIAGVDYEIVLVMNTFENKKTISVNGVGEFYFNKCTAIGNRNNRITLFKNGSTSGNNFTERFYYARIGSEDGLEYNLIPVMSHEDKPCLYDEVSGRLFYNQGTGEFSYGELDAV